VYHTEPPILYMNVCIQTKDIDIEHIVIDTHRCTNNLYVYLVVCNDVPSSLDYDFERLALTILDSHIHWGPTILQIDSTRVRGAVCDVMYIHIHIHVYMYIYISIYICIYFFV